MESIDMRRFEVGKKEWWSDEIGENDVNGKVKRPWINQANQ